jgi:hypothetical protein
VLNAALAGLGLAFLVEEQVTPLLKAGVLIRVLDDRCPPFPGFFLYYPGRRQASPGLTAFIQPCECPSGPFERGDRENYRVSLPHAEVHQLRENGMIELR